MYKLKSFLFLFLVVAFANCKKWDNVNKDLAQDLTINLMESINANPELSLFAKYAIETGLDSTLSASKTFTVWAPTNTALQTLDAAIIADKAKLKQFLQNHISNQLYFTKDVLSSSQNLTMLSGKYNMFSATQLGNALLNTTDKYVKNGVLHTLKSSLAVLPNIWEFINNTAATYNQNAFVVSLNYTAFDPNSAIVDSISGVTGLPIYKPGTGIVQRNRFNDRVVDLKLEDKQYTYFIIDNSNFTKEADSLKNYFATLIPAATDSLTRFNVIKDLIVETPYPTAASLPTSVVSKSGITVPINSSLITNSFRCSNGYVYVMSNVDIRTLQKFATILLQGENPNGFLSNDKGGNTNYRVRLNPVTQTNFNDILISGHGVTTFYSFYRTNELPSLKYKVYAKAINDFQAAAFSQTINAWNTSLGALTGTLPYAVPLFTAAGAYDEKYLGEITNTRYGTVDWRITSITTGPITLDYLRLEPAP
jgi:uncharacterized surface protein with fasciclin (FAS1) repeats